MKKLGLLKKIIDKKEIVNDNSSKNELLKHLNELKSLEAKLWGTTIKHISEDEEMVLENVNHMIHYFNNKSEKAVKFYLENKSVKEFLFEIKKIRDDFKYLRKQILKKDKLKNLISDFSIRLVEKDNYSKLENVFLLEKQLYEVLSKQEEEFKIIIGDIKKLSFEFKIDKFEVFKKTLLNFREILAGHMDHHALWEEEFQGYSNTSNIIRALIKEVDEAI